VNSIDDEQREENNALQSVQASQFSEAAELRRDGPCELIGVEVPDRAPMRGTRIHSD